MTDIALEILEPSGIPSSEQNEQSSPRGGEFRVAGFHWRCIDAAEIRVASRLSSSGRWFTFRLRS